MIVPLYFTINPSKIILIERKVKCDNRKEMLRSNKMLLIKCLHCRAELKQINILFPGEYELQLMQNVYYLSY